MIPVSLDDRDRGVIRWGIKVAHLAEAGVIDEGEGMHAFHTVGYAHRETLPATELEALLLVSNAEEILRDASVPVKAAKEKGAGMQVLDELLKR